MAEPKDYIEMTLKAAAAFANGGKIDSRELAEIVDIAERDGVIDQDEIRVLRNIIARVDPSEVDASMRRQLQEILEKISKR